MADTVYREMVQQVSSKRRIYNALVKRVEELRFEQSIAYIGEGKREIDKQLEIIELKVIPFFRDRIQL